jgi:hypothetical protein
VVSTESRRSRRSVEGIVKEVTLVESRRRDVAHVSFMVINSCEFMSLCFVDVNRGVKLWKKRASYIKVARDDEMLIEVRPVKSKSRLCSSVPHRKVMKGSKSKGLSLSASNPGRVNTRATTLYTPTYTPTEYGEDTATIHLGQLSRIFIKLIHLSLHCRVS